MVPGRGTAGLVSGPALRGAGACCLPLVWPGPDSPLHRYAVSDA